VSTCNVAHDYSIALIAVVSSSIPDVMIHVSRNVVAGTPSLRASSSMLFFTRFGTRMSTLASVALWFAMLMCITVIQHKGYACV